LNHDAKRIRVLLVDDHGVVRAGFRALLEGQHDIEIVGEAENAEQAIKRYVETRPNVVCMDISLPGVSGVSAIAELSAIDQAVKILVFSIHEELIMVEQALKAGALGYVTKSGAAELLPDAVRCVSAGNAYVESKLAQAFTVQRARGGKPALAGLTTREFEVFNLLVHGKDTHRIAAELRLSYRTIANDATQVRAKLKVKNNAELTKLAYEHGVLLHLPDVLRGGNEK
jgi:DNA-binding NarL/FixJ family response regulator